MYLGKKLRSLLEEKGLSQKDLAEKLHIAPSTLGNYVNDLREPDFNTLRLFADYFQVSTDFLLDHPHEKSNCLLDDQLLRIFHKMKGRDKQIYLKQGKVFLQTDAPKDK